MNIQRDCYYYLDSGVIKPICVRCYTKLKRGWFWPGASAGYGESEIKCTKCDEQIYKTTEHNEH